MKESNDFYSSHSEPCFCFGCTLKPATTNEWWHAFKQKVPLDLIIHFVGSVVTGVDVYSDLETGRGHWNDENYLWALTTWALMFMPSALSFTIQSAIIECRHSLKTVAVSLGHLPFVQPIYHLFILRNLKRLVMICHIRLFATKDLTLTICPPTSKKTL